MAVKKYEILGIPVSKEIYEKYTSQRYSMNGESWNFFSVKEVGTSAEIAEIEPELANAARDVLNQIKQEVFTEIGRSDKYVAKRHADFKGYISEAKEIYEKCLKKLEEIESRYQRESQEAKNEKAEHKADPLRTNIAEMRLNLAEENHRLGIRDTKTAMNDALAEVRNALEAHLQSFYTASPDKVDRAALDLMQSGLLTGDEVENMAERYRDNVTMLRYIGKYAKENEGTGSGKDKKLTILAYKLKTENLIRGGAEMKVFDDFLNIIKKAATNDSLTATNYSKTMEQFHEQSLSAFDAMPAQPFSGAMN